MVQLLWKTVWRLHKILKLELSYDHAIPHLRATGWHLWLSAAESRNAGSPWLRTLVTISLSPSPSLFDPQWFSAQFPPVISMRRAQWASQEASHNAEGHRCLPWAFFSHQRGQSTMGVYCSAMMTWERGTMVQEQWLSSSYPSHLFQIPLLSLYGWRWGRISLRLGLWDFQNGFFSLGICQLVYLQEDRSGSYLVILTSTHPFPVFLRIKENKGSLIQ